jgi:hypothetical protein
MAASAPSAAKYASIGRHGIADALVEVLPGNTDLVGPRQND